MTLQEEVNIIYRYIVEGKSMEDAAAYEGYSTSDASKMIRDYGFNNDAGQRSGWQSGKDRGRYKPGKPSARGLTVTKTMIREYLQQADEWDWEFDDFVADKAARNRPPQRPQPRPQQTYQPEPVYRPQPVYTPQPPQPSAWELEQQEKQKKQTAASKVQQGRTALQNRDIRGAYSALIEAHRLNPTWEGDLLLAETCARAGNAREHADDIIKLLTEHFDGYANGKHTLKPTADQYLWRAQAYLNKGDKNSACDDYFRAGDMYYAREDYINADRLYTEAREKTGYYSGSTPDAAFRVAYARWKGKTTLTSGDYQTCVTFYRKAIENNQQKPYAYGNMSWHLRMLGDYDAAVDAAEKAMSLGLHEEYVYNNLFWAQLANEEWEDAEGTLDSMKYRGYNHTGKRKELYDKWLKDRFIFSEDEALELMERLDREGYPYEPWLKGACLIRVDEEREAEGVALLKYQLQKDSNHLDALYSLLMTYGDMLTDSQRLEYGNRYLRAYSGADKSKYFYVETNYCDLAKEIVAGLQENERYRQERERKAAEEAERRRKEAEEARRRQEAEEEEERRRKAAEEARHQREAEEEAKRLRKEAEEAERQRKAAEEAERRRKAAEEAERLRRKKEEEETLLLLF